jgi:hypothetical protein
VVFIVLLLQLAMADGFVISGGLGYPKTSLENPDGSLANYDGWAFRLGLELPIIEVESFTFALTGAYKNLSLENSSNNAVLKETAKHNGYGGGAQITLGKVLVGANYLMMSGEHTASGAYSNNLEYEYDAIEYYAGLKFRKNNFSWSIYYSMTDAVVDKKELQSISDANWKDGTLWLGVSYHLPLDIGGIFTELFK